MPSAPSRGARGARPATSAPPSFSHRLAALLSLCALALAGGCGGGGDGDDRFDADRAFEEIERQVALGPRPAGSDASRQLAAELAQMLPDGKLEPVPGGLQNVVGTLPGPGPAVLIAAHYDTEAEPPGFVGANDGAAGTAAVVELARTLADQLPEGHREIRFVLFDGEEEPPGCPDARFEQCALRGSKSYAAAHADEIGEMVLLDYVANQGIRIPREGNSEPALWEELRSAAEEVGATEAFPPGAGPPIVDDHIPFIEAGVPAIDLIDSSYPYRDTLQDTPDKLSPEALDAIGETVAALVGSLTEPGAPGRLKR